MSAAEARFGAHITVRSEGEVARLTIDRPPLNLLDRPLLEALVAALAHVAERGEARVLVVTGGGERAFVGGVDIGAMVGLEPATAGEFIALLHAALGAIRRLPIPVVARIDGYALGGGLELACACDIRLASTRAQFGMPEVLVGIPSVIEAALIPGMIGTGRAMHFLMTGERVDVATAERWGLVSRAVPAEALDREVDAVVAALRRAAPGALAAQKRLVYEWQEAGLTRAFEISMRAFADAYRSAEPREGMTAFREKRAPGWAPE